MPESQTYEKPLREIFTDDDLELATRVARVCVLYEDLRIEYWGARAEGPLALDALSTACSMEVNAIASLRFRLRRVLGDGDTSGDTWPVCVPTNGERRECWRFRDGRMANGGGLETHRPKIGLISPIGDR